MGRQPGRKRAPGSIGKKSRLHKRKSGTIRIRPSNEFYFVLGEVLARKVFYSDYNKPDYHGKERPHAKGGGEAEVGKKISLHPPAAQVKNERSFILG